MSSNSSPAPTPGVNCLGCDLKPAVLHGLCGTCLKDMNDHIDSQGRAEAEKEDALQIQIDEQIRKAGVQ